jgi:hypothetical protein
LGDKAENGGDCGELLLMKKRWHQFATVDERWTFVTWIVFLGVTAIFFAGFWLVAGTHWMSFLRLTAGATVEASSDGLEDAAGMLGWFGMFAVFVPLVFSTIPALAVLLGISNWLTREVPQDES